VVEHVVDTGLFLSEIHRVLKPGGKLVLSTPNSAFWVYRLLGGLGRTVSELQHPGHLRFFSRKMLASACEGAGFNNVKIRGREIYLIFSTSEDTPLRSLLGAVGLKDEHRFGTKRDLWHYSRYARRASSFWADTLIVEATKPEPSATRP
jgi:SAM-dependent methyltransferase